MNVPLCVHYTFCNGLLPIVQSLVNDLGLKKLNLHEDSEFSVSKNNFQQKYVQKERNCTLANSRVKCLENSTAERLSAEDEIVSISFVLKLSNSTVFNSGWAEVPSFVFMCHLLSIDSMINFSIFNKFHSCFDRNAIIWLAKCDLIKTTIQRRINILILSIDNLDQN